MNWSWLLVLICPIMMILMMFGMGGHHGGRKGQGHNHSHGFDHGHEQGQQGSQGQQGNSSVDPYVYEEIEKLKMQNEQLRKEIQKLS